MLLILAGVTIATLTGENGILTRASEASERTKQANAEEQVQLAVVASIGTDGNVNLENLNKELEKIGAYYNENPISTEAGNENKIAEGDLPATVTLDGQEVTISISGDVVLGGKIKEYTDEGVPIPNGFYYVGGTKDTGVVISDNSNDENGIVGTNLEGNQFVWVPVVDDDFQRYTGYYDGVLDDYMPATSCAEPYASGYATEASEYEAMRNSVLKYDGFYVGRYEAGSTTERTEDSGITDDVVIKQGAYVYNWIAWSDNGNGNSQDDMNVETGGAVEKAKSFDTDNGYAFVTSTLIYGVQWDAIMQWIDPDYENGTCESNSFVANSDEKGYYNASAPTTTGSSDDYAVKNIYDLAGNVAEWTMESYNTDNRVHRGGSYTAGSGSPASNRNYRYPSSSDVDIGFRVTLYL